jgi:AcrR family transcriptional regulator
VPSTRIHRTRTDPVDVADAGAADAAADGAVEGEERRHTEHGRERKQQLLDAAAELFAERGYASTRIADICRAPGVAKGLFYWYFPTKGELFAELVRTMRLGLRRAQAAAMDPDADVVERIGQGTEASVRFMAEHAAYFALIDVERADPELAEVLSEGSAIYLDDVRRLIVEGQRDGSVPDADPTLLAVGVLGAVSSFSNAYRNRRLGADLTVDQLAAFVRGWVTSALR